MGRKSDIDARRFGSRLAAAREAALSVPADPLPAPAPAIGALADGRLPRMDGGETHSMALEAECRRQLIIRRIDAALARIESGEYGYCQSCGAPIAPARLESEPTVATCLGCAFPAQ